MNNRGMRLLLDSILGLIVAVILVLVLWPMFKTLLDFGTGDRETFTNFQELVNLANSQISPDKNYFNVNDWLYYISNKFILVGFNKDEEGSVDECDYEIVSRPRNTECIDNACLCLYRETNSDDDFEEGDIPAECKKVDVDYIFSLDYLSNEKYPYTDREQIYKNLIGPKFDISSKYYQENYARFFIYGQCEDFGLDTNFGVQKLYIEKVYDEESKKTFLFIADSDDSDRYIRRFEANTYKEEILL